MVKHYNQKIRDYDTFYRKWFVTSPVGSLDRLSKIDEMARSKEGISIFKECLNELKYDLKKDAKVIQSNTLKAVFISGMGALLVGLQLYEWYWGKTLL